MKTLSETKNNPDLIKLTLERNSGAYVEFLDNEIVFSMPSKEGSNPIIFEDSFLVLDSRRYRSVMSQLLDTKHVVIAHYDDINVEIERKKKRS